MRKIKGKRRLGGIVGLSVFMVVTVLLSMSAKTAEAKEKLESDEVFTNYFSLLEDNELLQLANDAKTSFAVAYINESIPKYKNLPIVSVSKNICYGKNGPSDYVEIEESLDGEDLYQLQNGSDVLRIYKVKGSVLREWLEWSASNYATEKNKGSYNVAEVTEYLSENQDVYALLSPACYYGWKHYYVFDGVDFSYDLSQNARYDASGTLINVGAHRIGTIIYNGRELSDDEEVLIACEKMEGSVKWLPNENDNLCADKKIRAYKVLKDYVKELGKLGKICLTADDNWNIQALSGKYLFTTGLYASKYAKNKPWFVERIDADSDYAYLVANVPEKEHGINVVLAMGTTKTDKTCIYVQTASFDSIKSIRVLKGKKHGAEDEAWSQAKDITEAKRFIVKKKRNYTVLVENEAGVKCVKSISVK